MKKLWLLFSALLVGCNPATVGSLTPAATGQAGQLQPAATERSLEAEAAATTLAETPPALSDVLAPQLDQTGITPVAELALPPAINPNLDHVELLNQLLFSGDNLGPDILNEIKASRDARFVAGLIEVMRWRRDLWPQLGATLNALTNQQVPPDWHDWVEWAGKHPELESFDGYVAWKAHLFSQIDPNFLRFVYKDMKIAPGSRVEEIVWGGVQVDGIPALDNPKMIDPAEADYLVAEERVFGLSINGDSRAYPARFLDWHEMFNDVVGGEPVSLAY
jgi:hypothetical protein